MTMVASAAALLPPVFVPSVLQILGRVFQELILFLPLKQGAHNGHALYLQLVFGHPCSCRGLGTSFCLKTDLCLSFSLLVGDEGNVTTIFVNVHTAFVFQHLLDILPRDLPTKPSELENRALGQFELLLLFLLSLLFAITTLGFRFLIFLLILVLLLLHLFLLLFQVVFLELLEKGLLLIFLLL